MNDLSHQSCEACRADSPSVPEAEQKTLMQALPGWSIEDHDGVMKLEKTFRFDDFLKALVFTNKVGELAETEGHHPRLVTEWGRVAVTWWTHKIKGLHRNDFIMAAKTDEL